MCRRSSRRTAHNSTLAGKPCSVKPIRTVLPPRALPPVKIHCSILAEDAIKAAVDDYKKKHLN